nr:hypothetical protein [Tanacetum cinerariifolium]
LTVSRTEPKNIKEAMANSAWIESMQTSSKRSIRLVHDPFINSKLARSGSNHDPELEVFEAERTIQDAERIEQWVDHLH